MIKTAVMTFAPVSAIAIIFAVRAVISRGRKTRGTVDIRYRQEESQVEPLNCYIGTHMSVQAIAVNCY